jgi:ABC-type Fe3+-hydroxamate transport system substrate-binding protein
LIDDFDRGARAPRFLFVNAMRRTTTALRAILGCAAASLVAVACAQPETPSRTLRDDLGRDVHVGELKRVVTLAPNITQILFAVGAGERIVATDDYSDEPAAARALPKVGGLNPNVERIATARPDLVIATTNGNPPSLEPSLKAAGIPLFVLRTDRLDHIPVAMIRLSELLGGTRGDAAAAEVRAAIDAQRRKRASAPRVLFAVWTDPLYVGARNTFADDLLQLTGAANAVAVEGWPQLSLEAVAANPPDIVLYPDRSVTPQQVASLLRRVPALASSKIVAVDENLFTRPGPRVGEAAAALNAILDQWERSRP